MFLIVCSAGRTRKVVNMRRAWTIVLLLSLGCGDVKSPVAPAPPPLASTPDLFSLSGSVTDTAQRSLSGSNVEVIAGQGAGTVTTTDEHGRFRMPETLTGIVTIRASKDGYIAQTATFPPNFPPGRFLPPLPPGEVRRWDTHLSLQPDGPAANLVGEYTLTVDADSTCTNLPGEVRTRTYTATLGPGSQPTRFIGRLNDARMVFSIFFPYLEIRTAGDFSITSLRIVEQLDEMSYLAIEGEAPATVGPSGITASFSANFLHCPTRPEWSPGEYLWCGANVQGRECNSQKHQLTLVRR
jgi:hypothetical protein